MTYSNTNNVELKKCEGGRVSCGKLKKIDEFEFRKDIGKYRKQCKECVSKSKQLYYDENKEKIKQKVKLRRVNNLEKVKKEERKSYHKNKEKKKITNKKYREDNKKIIKIKKQLEYKNNKEYIKERAKKYRQQNKEKRNAKERERRKKDPKFRLRKTISGIIWQRLNKKGSSKNGESISKYFPTNYFDNLIERIEILFSHPDNLRFDGKPWMTWNNQGKYNPNTYDERDPSTWTWQLDHIQPDAQFNYKKIEDQEFQDSNALDNLRPLNSKINTEDQNNRTPEQIYIIKKSIADFFVSKKDNK